MILRKELCRVLRLQGIDSWGILTRFYSSNVDLRNLRPMILERIEERAKMNRVSDVYPLAQEVLNARGLLIRGVSALLKVFRVKTCKFCSEVYIGEKGHLIPTCHGYRRRGNNRHHEWVDGSIDDILVPVETSDHSSCLFRDYIKQQHQRIPAVVKLCYKTGAEPQDEKTLHPCPGSFGGVYADNIEAESVWDHDLCLIANGTLKAWEVVRSGVRKLLMSYPAQICEHCSKVHVGLGHKARVYEHESLQGLHLWRKAEVDDLLPPKMVWHRRSQDPLILVEKGREFYGHAPAVVSLCAQAGGIPPVKYNCMMKVQGLPGPITETE